MKCYVFLMFYCVVPHSWFGPKEIRQINCRIKSVKLGKCEIRQSAAKGLKENTHIYTLSRRNSYSNDILLLIGITDMTKETPLKIIDLTK